MKVVVLGGSAYSTPALWSYVVNEAKLEGVHIVLMGRDRRLLQAVTRACQLLTDRGGNELSLALADEEGWTCLKNAAIVLIQIRNGGFPGRAFDESFPPRYGICGDEGLGPGGLCAGIRNWKAIGPALHKVQRYAPDATILMMSSPVGLLVRAARRQFPDLNVVGICELPWTTLLNRCQVTGLEPTGMQFDYFGVNHLGWLYGLQKCGRLVAEDVPMPYLRLHQDMQSVVREQRATARTRGDQLEQASRFAYDTYMTGDRQLTIQCVTSRETPWYRHAIGPLISAVAGRNLPIPFFLSVPNAGFDSNYRADDVLEYLHRVHNGSLERQARIRPIPTSMRETIRRFVLYERAGTTATLKGGFEDVRAALMEHPWVHPGAAVAQMAREIVRYAAAC